MSRTQNAEDFCPIQPYAQRGLFAFSLRRRYQGFWRSLNEIWREGCTGLTVWMREKGVVDSWLIDIVNETIDMWASDPKGPNATLHEDYAWYRLPVQVGSEVSDFRPVFDKPYPIWNGPDTQFMAELWPTLDSSAQSKLLCESHHGEWAEPLEAFEKRMEEQFRAQLTEYVKSVRSPYGYKATPQTIKNADWTALAFAGLPYAEIVRWDLTGAPHLDPESAVRKAVVRFAEEISLTLGKKHGASSS